MATLIPLLPRKILSNKQKVSCTISDLSLFPNQPSSLYYISPKQNIQRAD